MALLPPAQAEEHLRQVARQFAQWRQHRANPRGSRIPEALWAEALALAAVLPPTRVARDLGLKPHALKRRRGDHARTGHNLTTKEVNASPASPVSLR
jgi:hypothetical protein